MPEANPFEAADDNPFARFAEDTPRANARSKRKGVGRKVDAAIRGAADFMTLGYADEFAGAMDSLPALMPGGESYGDAYRRNVADERAIDDADRQQTPIARGVGEGAALVSTLGAGLANAPRAAASTTRTLIPSARNALQASAVGAGYGGLAASGNAEGGPWERVKASAPGAAFGAVLGPAALPVAHLGEMGVNALRRYAAPPLERAANALTGRVNVPAARARAEELRASGIEPSAINTMDDAGRGFVAAAAKRQTPARDVVQRRADAARVNLPGRVSRQAERISTDRRTPDQIREELTTRRRNLAQDEYAEPYAQPVAIEADMAEALQGAPGRAAMQRARQGAEAFNDRAQMAEIDRLMTGDLETPVSAGTIDRIRIAMGERAERARVRGARDIGAGLTQREGAIDAGLDDIGGLAEARGTYRDLSRQIEGADLGEEYLTRNTDEFVAGLDGATPETQATARATARRAVERRAGESPAGALSTAESIAIAPEQQARTRAIMPEDEAQGLERAMGAEVRNYRDLQQVAPRTGSQTNLNSQDQEAAANLAGGVATALGGPKAWAGALLNRLRSAGVSDRDAQSVADVATDPAMLDQLFAKMEKIEPGSSQYLREIINQTVIRSEGEATTRQP